MKTVNWRTIALAVMFVALGAVVLTSQAHASDDDSDSDSDCEYGCGGGGGGGDDNGGGGDATGGMPLAVTQLQLVVTHLRMAAKQLQQVELVRQTTKALMFKLMPAITARQRLKTIRRTSYWCRTTTLKTVYAFGD